MNKLQVARHPCAALFSLEVPCLAHQGWVFGMALPQSIKCRLGTIVTNESIHPKSVRWERTAFDRRRDFDCAPVLRKKIGRADGEVTFRRQSSEVDTRGAGRREWALPRLDDSSERRI